MFHPKREDGRGEVGADFGFLGIEAGALRDVAGAGGAEDGEGHFETDGLGGAMEAGGLFAVDGIAGGEAFKVWGDVASEGVS